MKELIEYSAKSLVDQPDAVKVTEVEGEKTLVLELSVNNQELLSSIAGGAVLLDILDTEEETHKKWQPLSDCHYYFTVL